MLTVADCTLIQREQLPDSPPSGWLAAADFATACAALPLVSVDVYVTRQVGKARELLLGLRNNRPAKGWWFTPGGRVRKGETVPKALERVIREELGIPSLPLMPTRLLGVWDHTYPDSAFNPQTSTHYVNLAYALELPALCIDQLPTIGVSGASSVAQHSQWRWHPLPEVACATDIHAFVKPAADLLVKRLHSEVNSMQTVGGKP